MFSSLRECSAAGKPAHHGSCSQEPNGGEQGKLHDANHHERQLGKLLSRKSPRYQGADTGAKPPQSESYWVRSTSVRRAVTAIVLLFRFAATYEQRC